jgi:hypothetical protein
MLFRFIFVILVIVTPWYAEQQLNAVLPNVFYPFLAIYYMVAAGAIIEGMK